MNRDPNRNNPPSHPGAHHVRQKYCQTRPLYRRSRQLTAVRAYSVANESRHLLVFGVPQIELLRELRQQFVRFGPIEYIRNITESWLQEHGGEEDDLRPEPYTDVFHVCLVKLEKARQAKKVLDAKNFYGGILHISYAPERESVAEVRAKVEQRKVEVRYRLKLSRQQQHHSAPKQSSLQSPCPGGGGGGGGGGVLVPDLQESQKQGEQILAKTNKRARLV